MSYACFDIYYGVPLTPEKRATVAFALSRTDPGLAYIADENDSDLEGYLEEILEGVQGFHSPYSGWADYKPMAYGVSLDSFDESEHDIKVSSLVLAANDTIKAQYQAMYDKLSVEHRKVVDAFGEPHVFFLVSTS